MTSPTPKQAARNAYTDELRQLRIALGNLSQAEDALVKATVARSSKLVWQGATRAEVERECGSLKGLLHAVTTLTKTLGDTIPYERDHA